MERYRPINLSGEALRREEVEKLKEKFGSVVELFTDNARVVNVVDILKGKKIPQMPAGSGESTFFVAETVKKMTIRDRDTRIKEGRDFATGAQKIETLARLLRTVDSKDRGLVAEFLALSSSEQRSLGVSFSRTIAGEGMPTEVKEHKILDTSGQLMEYLGQATQK